MSDHYGFETLATSLDDGILRVAFNRPKRLNALNARMHEELRDLFGRIERDDAVDVVILTGNGSAFCVGADFDQMEENLARGGYPDGHPSLLGDAAAMARNILAVRQPMIAAINGDAIGLGATLALFCDITYMAAGARIGDPHVRAGIVAGDGGPVLWPMLVGANRAKEYLLTGDLLTAEEAERIGLVNHVVPPEQLDEAVTKMARRLAAGPQIAIRFNKRLVNKELEDRVSRIYDLALALEAITFETADHQEAVRAFLEKRKP
ncbi:MAG TPA: enoyl-CoA hydratase/isomerase family protein, partial [Acidimicrobiales bacterium]